jgi:hypothetical protein
MQLHGKRPLHAWAGQADDRRSDIGEGADRLPCISARGNRGVPVATIQMRVPSQIRPFPAVRELLERIHANGCKLVLASSCASDEIDRYTAIAGISDMTDCDVTGDDESHLEKVASSETANMTGKRPAGPASSVRNNTFGLTNEVGATPEHGADANVGRYVLFLFESSRRRGFYSRIRPVVDRSLVCL